MTDNSLPTGPLELTNEWYAIAKIADVKVCDVSRKPYGFNANSPMPTNLYGPGDNFDLSSSHVLPALLRKFHDDGLHGDAEVTIWDSGQSQREIMHVDDFANAGVHLYRAHDQPGVIIVGVGSDVSIAEAASLIREIVGFQGRIIYGITKLDGMPRKLLDVSKLKALEWHSEIDFRDGVGLTCRWSLDQPIHRGD
ncbi:MAG: NAD-dependent epimerase/dehydratase family protein [Nevskia sp.]|uniref:NAD-dependent epimerase/dehydratase family protein n=1 Tax=Nevskia sp. TaxID=1929292 RepID=UPI0040362195